MMRVSSWNDCKIWIPMSVCYYFHLPYWFVLDFWKINLEKSSSTNWIFSLFRTEFLLPAQPSKINFEIDFCRLKIQFVELDFSNSIFQNSSTDQQGDCLLYWTGLNRFLGCLSRISCPEHLISEKSSWKLKFDELDF